MAKTKAQETQELLEFKEHLCNIAVEIGALGDMIRALEKRITQKYGRMIRPPKVKR